MRGRQVAVDQLLSGVRQLAMVRECLLWAPFGSERRHFAVEECVSLRRAQALQNIVVCDDAHALAPQPLIGADMVEMEMRVDEDRDGGRADRPGSLIHRIGGLRQAAVHQQKPVLALHDGYVSPGAAEQGQLRADRMQLQGGRVLRARAPRQPKCRRHGRCELEKFTASEASHEGHCS